MSLANQAIFPPNRHALYEAHGIPRPSGLAIFCLFPVRLAVAKTEPRNRISKSRSNWRLKT